MFKRGFVLITLIIMALALVGTASASHASTANRGDYFISGRDLKGEAISGGMEIAGTHIEGMYLVTGQFSQPYRGLGLDVSDKFAVGFGGTQCSLGLYQPDGRGGYTGEMLTTELNGIHLQTLSADGEGRFSLDSTTPNGDEQRGAIEFRETGKTLAVEMTLDGQTFRGVGLEDQDFIAVGFGDDECGVRLFHVTNASRLRGMWTLMGHDDWAPEDAFILDISGEYAVAGTNLDGTEYEGTLWLEPNVNVHNIRWQIQDSVYEGVAVLRGAIVAAGFGGDHCAVRSYVVSNEGHLIGSWALPNQSDLGHENAVRIGRSNGDLAGEYELADRREPGTENFEQNVGTLLVQPLDTGRNDGAYTLTWSLDGAREEGVGFLFDNTLAAVSGEGCGINAYYADPESLFGIWTMVGATVAEIEVASR